MGRVARYKKVKNIANDVRWQAKEAQRDQAPVKGQGDKPSRALRRIMESKMKYEKIKSGEFVTKVQARAQKRQEAMKSVPRQAGESQEAYENRVERTYNELVNDKLKKVTKKSQKRKAYLEEKKKKSQKRNMTAEEAHDEGYKREQIKFGETNAAPPSLSSVPKRRHNIKPETAPLLLDQKLAETKKKEKVKTGTGVKRRDMSEQAQKQHDEARQAAIDQYRELKKQRESARGAAE